MSITDDKLKRLIGKYVIIDQGHHSSIYSDFFFDKCRIGKINAILLEDGTNTILSVLIYGVVKQIELKHTYFMYHYNEIERKLAAANDFYHKKQKIAASSIISLLKQGDEQQAFRMAILSTELRHLCFFTSRLLHLYIDKI